MLVSVVIIAICSLALMALEALLPTAGMLGLLGAGLIALNIYLCWTRWGVVYAIVLALVCIALSVLIFRAVMKSMKQGRLSRSGLFMKEELPQAVYAAAIIPVKPGSIGRTVTALRPMGIAELDGRRVHVITEGAFMDVGTEVVVLRAEGTKIIVGKLDNIHTI